MPPETPMVAGFPVADRTGPQYQLAQDLVNSVGDVRLATLDQLDQQAWESSWRQQRANQAAQVALGMQLAQRVQAAQAMRQGASQSVADGLSGQVNQAASYNNIGEPIYGPGFTAPPPELVNPPPPPWYTEIPVTSSVVPNPDDSISYPYGPTPPVIPPGPIPPAPPGPTPNVPGHPPRPTRPAMQCPCPQCGNLVALTVTPQLLREYIERTAALPPLPSPQAAPTPGNPLGDSVQPGTLAPPLGGVFRINSDDSWSVDFPLTAYPDLAALVPTQAAIVKRTYETSERLTQLDLDDDGASGARIDSWED